MLDIDFNNFLNELYEQSLTLGMATALSVATQKFLKMSLGAPVSARPFLMLALALGVEATLLKILQDKYNFPSNPFEKKGKN